MHNLKKTIKIWTGLTLGLFFLPNIVFAQTLIDFLDEIFIFIEAALPVLISLAVLFFLWGLARYMLKTDDVEGRKGAKDIMMWGVIIIFVMTSLWGLVNLLELSFGLDDVTPDFPQLFE